MNEYVRYTAEHRGGDWGEEPLEWCVVDEDEGLFGSAVVFDLTEQEAKDKACELNSQEDAWCKRVDNKGVTHDY
jgi:hypothetical protein